MSLTMSSYMQENGILTFEFRGIFLPDSTSNFEGSQGYISYLIRTVDGLPENTPVTNSAGIYFDLNPPVITRDYERYLSHIQYDGTSRPFRWIE